MADLVSNIQKLNDIEVAQKAPVSESVLSKLGANINALIDLMGFKSQTFSSSSTFDVPVNVTKVLIFFRPGSGGGSHGISRRNRDRSDG